MTEPAGGSRYWPAPRTAYAIAAEWQDAVTAALSGGEGGCHPPGLSKLWQDLDTAGKADVITALGAQVRSAALELLQSDWVPGAAEVGWDNPYFGPRMCELARQAFATLTALRGDYDAWETPDCPHCLDLLAESLAAAHCAAIRCSGIAEPAVLLHSLAEVEATV